MEFFLMSAQGQGTGMSITELMTPFLIVFFIMWLLVIRPQRKEQKLRQEMLANLKKGDLVVSQGGIIGKIMKVKEDKIELKVDESSNTKITFLRSAILNIMPKDSKKDSKKDKNTQK